MQKIEIKLNGSSIGSIAKSYVGHHPDSLNNEPMITLDYDDDQIFKMALKICFLFKNEQKEIIHHLQNDESIEFFTDEQITIIKQQQEDDKS